MATRKHLLKAQINKNDEFYTQLTDIERELMHYKNHFQDKVVYCNCDDPTVSNFFKYFSLNFNQLGLKKLITTCYKNQNPDIFSLHDVEKSIGIEISREKNSKLDLQQRIFEMKADGDFRSQECIDLLKQADIVVTNPPFSLFREYLAQLIQYEKYFIIIGNKNAITYKEVFPLIKENKMWIGVTSMSKDMLFDVSKDYAKELIETKKEGSGYKIVDGVVKGRASGIWFTNLDYQQRHENLVLFKEYNSEEYPAYYNFNAINIDKTKYIPMDYDGVMGVPITFLDKHSPQQFEIIGLGIANLGKLIGVKPYTEQHRMYRKEIQKRGTVDGDLYMIKDGEVVVPYARVLIRNKRI